MAHMKRSQMPMFWPVKRKEKVFVTRPASGPHPIANCIPLQVLLRNYLSLAQTTSEVKKILNTDAVLIDKKVRKDHSFPIGFMDVVEIPKLKQFYRVFVNKRGLMLTDLKEADTTTKQCRIQGKKTIKGGKEAVSLHDGRTLITDTKSGYRVGDTLVISLPDQTVQKHVKLETGAQALIFAGRNKGTVGTVKEIKNRENALIRSTITLETAEGPIETPKNYVMAGTFETT